MATTKKPNPQDLTLRNLRAIKKELQELKKDVKQVKKDVKKKADK